MNKENFVNYESDISKARGFSALPPMHQQAYEIIKEASSDFSDWDQLIAVAEEPDIEKLIQIHLEWLKTTLTQKHVDSHVIVARPNHVQSKVSNTPKKLKVTPETPATQPTSKTAKPSTPASKPGKAKFLRWDNWNRGIYQFGDQQYVDVDGVLHVMTADGEPEHPVRNVKFTPKKRPKAKADKKPMPKVTGGELRYGDDVKFIRAFLAFLKSDQGRSRMVNLFKRMEKANAEKRFTGSQYKTALNSIVTALYEGITTEKSRISYPEPGKQRLEEIRDKNSLSYSVQVMKRFFNMIGEKPSRDQIEKLLHMAEKVGDTDQNYTHIKRIQYHLSEALQNNRKEITIDQPSIQGLAGVLRDCGCKLSRGKWEGFKGKKV